MTIFMRRFVLSLVLVWVVVHPGGVAGSTLSYLQLISDQFQGTVDVYTDADAAGNRFAARGEFDDLQAGRVAAMDEISTSAPCFGITCITATFDPGSALWGGWYFLNGVLGSADRQPSPNWGGRPNAGYGLSGATALRFWARGAVGGEVVHFFAFGVGNTAAPFQPYPDSAAKVEFPGGALKLTTMWTQYTIPLAGLDLHYVLGGFGWMANAVESNRLQPPLTFYIDNIQYLKARPNDSRLLVSYKTIKSTNSFDMVVRNAAYVYDNAVAMIAMIAAGDLARAKTIADALIYAQNNDRFFTDGRVRNAYQGGDIALPPGWLPNNLPGTVRMPGWYDAGHTAWFEDQTQVSTNTGNVAWAGLALLDMWEITKTPTYLTAVEALGNWVLSNASETRGGAAGLLGGFTGGFDGWENGAARGGLAVGACASGVLVNGQCKRLYKSTEHNIDLYSMYSRLYLADGNPKWATAAQQAKHFFLSMWEGGKFWTGTAEDGVTLSTDVIPLDIQVWSLEALGTEAQAYQQSLGYIESHHKTSLGYGFKQDGGNSCGDSTWFEGTSQVALAYLLTNNPSKWRSILDGVHSVQTKDGGIPATDGACLNTGFTLDDGSPWEYFPRVHVGATGWLALAENGVNPYRADLYSPKLSSLSVAFGDQNVGIQGSSRTVSFSNPGVGALNIRGITLIGANAPEFQQSNNCGTGLPSGATCTITLSFIPGAAGPRDAALAISESSDGAMTPAIFSVSLRGAGVAQQSSFTLTLNSAPQSEGTISAAPASSNGAYIAQEKKWVVVWKDEFDGPAYSAPDAAKWGYDTGATGWGNHELEDYKRDSANAFLDGEGHLVIRAIRTESGKYTSARLKTIGRFEFQYGRVEARIRVPYGQGIWPAFWMLGKDIGAVGWPQCGEIDIMENMGKEPSLVHGTVHGPGYSGAKGITAQTGLPGGARISDEFHVFRVDWSPDSVEFFLDNSSYAKVRRSDVPAGSRWVFDHPFFILLNVAVGGDWPGNPDRDTIFPQSMVVDWIRVWQPGGE